MVVSTQEELDYKRSSCSKISTGDEYPIYHYRQFLFYPHATKIERAVGKEFWAKPKVDSVGAAKIKTCCECLS